MVCRMYLSFVFVALYREEEKKKKKKKKKKKEEAEDT